MTASYLSWPWMVMLRHKWYVAVQMDSLALEASLGLQAQQQQRTPLQALLASEGPDSTFHQDAIDYFSLAVLENEVRSFNCTSCALNSDCKQSTCQPVGRYKACYLASPYAQCCVSYSYSSVH